METYPGRTKTRKRDGCYATVCQVFVTEMFGVCPPTGPCSRNQPHTELRGSAYQGLTPRAEEVCLPTAHTLVTDNWIKGGHQT